MPVGNIFEVQNGRTEEWKGKQEAASLWSVGCIPTVPISPSLCVLWHCWTWAVKRLAALTESLSLSVKKCCFSAFAAQGNSAHLQTLLRLQRCCVSPTLGPKQEAEREFGVRFTVGGRLQPSHLSAFLRGHKANNYSEKWQEQWGVWSGD